MTLRVFLLQTSGVEELRDCGVWPEDDQRSKRRQRRQRKARVPRSHHQNERRTQTPGGRHLVTVLHLQVTPACCYTNMLLIFTPHVP